MPCKKKQHIAGLLLAGGRSERLGGIDKGLLSWRGIALAEHVLRRVAPQVGGLALSYNRNQAQYRRLLEKYAPRGHNALTPALLEDGALPQFAGPLAGIFSMLQLLEHQDLRANQHRYEYLFVCCCDTPGLPQDIVDKLLQRISHGYDAVYPLVGKNHMRLTLLLNIAAGRDAMERWQAAGDDDFSVKNWLRYLNSKALPLPDRHFGANVNRQQDLALLDAGPQAHRNTVLRPTQD